MSRLLEGYGARVQMSAFEFVFNDSQYVRMLADVDKIQTKEDNIRIYDLSNDYEVDDNKLITDIYIV